MASAGQISGCPICGKEFPLNEIESHADRCLFLNSTTSPGASLKRSHEEYGGSTGGIPTSAVSPEASPVAAKVRRKSFKQTGASHHVDIKSKPKDAVKPLAELMRPDSIDGYIGQEHLLGDNTVLRNLLQSDRPPSMILWGPPGCGKVRNAIRTLERITTRMVVATYRSGLPVDKGCHSTHDLLGDFLMPIKQTSLAHVIHQRCSSSGTRFLKLSATLAGISDVKEVVKTAQNELNLTKRRTILFMDEIHRFNKLQQDVFLPHVESGLITLIGATTENPSFSLNNALLSRCRVFVLEKLTTENVQKILERALEKVGATVKRAAGQMPSNSSKYVVDEECVKWLAEMCDGDARIALNSLQIALESTTPAGSVQNGPAVVTLENIKEGIKRSHMLYDRKGEEHYNIISALHKSIRASDDNAALYWLTRMMEGGEDPIFIARRLVRAASEDIGLADPLALGMAVSAMQACQLVGMPECDVFLAQTAVYLARAPKSTEVYKALTRAQSFIKKFPGPQPSVPLYLRNAPTRLMKDLGYAKGYNMLHKDASGLNYLPESINVNFFEPSTAPHE